MLALKKMEKEQEESVNFELLEVCEKFWRRW